MHNFMTRRNAIRSMVGSSILLPGILSELLAEETKSSLTEGPLTPKAPHFTAKAKRVIFLFATGGVSHIDSFDPKPSANGRDGSGKDKLMGSVFPYSPNKKCGTEVSDLFPQLREQMEDICVIRSMKSAHFDHTEAAVGMHTGSPTFARPSMGSWLSYGLGTINQNLPSFIVVAPHLPYGGTQVYASDFLPAYHQGTRVIPGKHPIENLAPLTTRQDIQQLELGLTEAFNRGHLKLRQDDTQLAARIKSFETAFQMQTAGPEAFDVNTEDDKTLEAYALKRGENTGFGWQCLVARRLAERGVRFIELIDTGSRPNWDSHGEMKEHVPLAKAVDQPIAALIKDLKQRSMLDETLIVWATEFGRTPTKEGKNGRGHHGNCFSIWLAGGGIKGGIVHGETDEIGKEIVSDKVDVHDLHATILHLMGIDHTKLTYRHAGRDFRLTDVHGNVIKNVIA
ncbi:MAG TPA: DUF1501 domain-containing protein [Planctomycetaceae bacterium]|uniref:Sulfatase n=2 Tax=Rubinisphaera italica TaxID=2527969 RepID=A0A5C5XC25_9PLAN|nr:hypothetical protein Pan54_01780 [Rubinisphaera italica]HBN74276.1 DUF1501 domain-containing protein [Planctomycetaceae bacterium]